MSESSRSYSRLVQFILQLSIPVLLGFQAVNAADLVADYFSGLNTFHAKFEQTVVDSNGQQVQDSEGQVWIQRPGRFRWDYQTPYRQLIVADGEQLWTYDEDLEQATVKLVDEALSSTPAMLLSGFRPLSEVMTWAPHEVDCDADGGTPECRDNDGRIWFRLDPRQSDSAVERVRIAFEKEQLTMIEVVDGFGNHTRIRFSDIYLNQSVAPELFKLRLPAGTDIIGDSP